MTKGRVELNEERGEETRAADDPFVNSGRGYFPEGVSSVTTPSDFSSP
jgi:hypothetical protein